jgi:hypothetical protein
LYDVYLFVCPSLALAEMTRFKSLAATLSSRGAGMLCTAGDSQFMLIPAGPSQEQFLLWRLRSRLSAVPPPNLGPQLRIGPEAEQSEEWKVSG